MYAICESFKWTLPVAGGLYDQDPELLDMWFIIANQKAVHDKAEREKQNNRMGPKGKSGQLGKSPPRNIKGPKLAGRFNDGYG